MALTAKSPALHLVASMFVPGLGSMLCGRKSRGAMILAAMAACYVAWFGLIIVVFASASSSPLANRGVPASFAFIPVLWLAIMGIWIFGLVDAYRSAQAWNLAHGILS